MDSTVVSSLPASLATPPLPGGFITSTFKTTATALVYPEGDDEEDDEDTDRVRADTVPSDESRREGIVFQPVRISFARSHLLGVGCFGVVFSAEIRRVSFLRNSGEEKKREWKCWNSKSLAVKTLLVRRRESRELAILKSINHDNIVKLHFYFFGNDRSSSRGRKGAGNSQCFYGGGDDNNEDEEDLARKDLCLNLFFELLPSTLYDELRRVEENELPALSEPVVVVYLRQLLSGLAFLHEMNICHRDIKPSNLLIDPDLLVLKICDLGSAKRIDSSHEHNASYICSRYYRAPELLLEAKSYCAKVDIWSVGCVLAEMLAGGEPVFRGESNVHQLVEIICVLGRITKHDLLEMCVFGAEGQRLLLAGSGPGDGLGPGGLACEDRLLLCARIADDGGGLRERLRAKLAATRKEDVSRELLQILCDVFQYIPWTRPCAKTMIRHLDIMKKRSVKDG